MLISLFAIYCWGVVISGICVGLTTYGPGDKKYFNMKAINVILCPGINIIAPIYVLTNTLR